MEVDGPFYQRISIVTLHQSTLNFKKHTRSKDRRERDDQRFVAPIRPTKELLLLKIEDHVVTVSHSSRVIIEAAIKNRQPLHAVQYIAKRITLNDIGKDSPVPPLYIEYPLRYLPKQHAS